MKHTGSRPSRGFGHERCCKYPRASSLRVGTCDRIPAMVRIRRRRPAPGYSPGSEYRAAAAFISSAISPRNSSGASASHSGPHARIQDLISAT